MTEADWLTATDPSPILRYLRGKVSDRKLRLFVCASCRRNESNIAKQAFRDALTAAERYADGLIGDGELQAVSAATALQSSRRVNMVQAHAQAHVHWATQPDDEMPAAAGIVLAKKPTAQIWQSAILRCIFGNPFRPAAFDPHWRSETAVALATGIYADRAFDRMPILADALEEAGCDHDDVLNHCRGPGPHARGCWVVDLVLGKE
jgi:hypothetical protein